MTKTQLIRALLVMAAILAGTIGTNAQNNPKPCEAAGSKHRQFDFWIGDWNVRVNDKPAGTNEVRSILGGCVIFENWTGAGGGSGKSFNFFNRQTGKWHQTWVDDRGGVLELDGEFIDGAMKFAGETRDTKGAKILQKLTFFPLPENKIRQLWESSSDDGKTWKTVFDGIYLRKAGQ